MLNKLTPVLVLLQFFHIFCFLPLFLALKNQSDFEGLSLYTQEMFLVALLTR